MDKPARGLHLPRNVLGEAVLCSDTKTLAAQEWKGGGWTLVLSTFVGFSFLSIMTGSLSMFMEPLGEEFGWSRTTISGGFTIASIITAILSPFFGVLIDRYGSRRIALPGIIGTICCICAFSQASGAASQWLLLWGVYAFVSITVKTTVWTAAVVGVFSASQGLALGITLCGTAAAQTILPPLSHWLIETYGWRNAYLFLGLGWGSITFVLCWFFLFDAHDRKKSADARQAAAGLAKAEPVVFPGLTIPQAWRSGPLWVIALTTLVIMALTMGFSIHQIAILGETGISRGQAALLASAAGIAGIAGKLVTGYLLDRFRANWVGGVTLGAAALVFAFLIDGVHSYGLIVAAMIVNGYTAGTKMQITGYLTARYGGMRHFGSIYGFMTSMTAFGSAVGPLIAAGAYDLSGDYGVFLIVGAIGSLLCGLLLVAMPRYPDWQAREQPAA